MAPKRSADEAHLEDSNRPNHRPVTFQQTPQGDYIVQSLAEQASVPISPDIPLPSDVSLPSVEATLAAAQSHLEASATALATASSSRGQQGRGRGITRGAARPGQTRGVTGSSRVDSASQAYRNSQQFRQTYLAGAHPVSAPAGPVTQDGAAGVVGTQDYPMEVIDESAGEDEVGDEYMEEEASQEEVQHQEEVQYQEEVQEQKQQQQQQQRVQKSNKRKRTRAQAEGEDQGNEEDQPQLGAKKKKRSRRRKNEKERDHSKWVRDTRGEGEVSDEMRKWMREVEAVGGGISKELLDRKPKWRTGQSCDRCVSLKLSCDPLPVQCGNCRYKQADCNLTDRNTMTTFKRDEIESRGREIMMLRGQLHEAQNINAGQAAQIRWYERNSSEDQRMQANAYANYYAPGYVNHPGSASGMLESSAMGGASDGFTMQAPSLQASYAMGNPLAQQPLGPGHSAAGQMSYPAQLGLMTAVPPTNQFAGNQGTNVMNVPAPGPYQGGPGPNMRPSRAPGLQMAMPSTVRQFAVPTSTGGTYTQQEPVPHHAHGLSQFQQDVMSFQQPRDVQRPDPMDYSQPLEALRPRQDALARFPRPPRSVPQQGPMPRQESAPLGLAQPSRTVQSWQAPVVPVYAQPSQVSQPSMPGGSQANPAVFSYPADINLPEGTGYFAGQAGPYASGSSTNVERTVEGCNPQRAPGIEGRDLNEGRVQEGPSAAEREDFTKLFEGDHAPNAFDLAFEEHEGEAMKHNDNQASDPAPFAGAEGQAQAGAAQFESSASSQLQTPMAPVSASASVSSTAQHSAVVTPRSAHLPTTPAYLNNQYAPRPPALATDYPQPAPSLPTVSPQDTQQATDPRSATEIKESPTGSQGSRAPVDTILPGGFDSEWNDARLQMALGALNNADTGFINSLTPPPIEALPDLSTLSRIAGYEDYVARAKESSSSSDNNAQGGKGQEGARGTPEQQQQQEVESEKDAEFEEDTEYNVARPEGVQQQQEPRGPARVGPSVSVTKGPACEGPDPLLPASAFDLLPPVPSRPVLGNPDEYDTDSIPLFPGVDIHAQEDILVEDDSKDRDSLFGDDDEEEEEEEQDE